MLQRSDAWCIADITSFFALFNHTPSMTGMRPNGAFFTMEKLPKA